VKHHRVFYSGVAIAENQQRLWRAHKHRLLLVEVPAGEKPGLLHGPTAGTNRPGVVPRRQLPPGHSQVDGFYFTSVRADVGFSILQFIQSVDRVNPPGSGDVPHPERKGNLFRETVQKCVKCLKGAIVDDHAQAVELRISTFVEADPLR